MECLILKSDFFGMSSCSSNSCWPGVNCLNLSSCPSLTCGCQVHISCTSFIPCDCNVPTGGIATSYIKFAI